MLEALEFRLSYFQVGIQVIADILQSALCVENQKIDWFLSTYPASLLILLSQDVSGFEKPSVPGMCSMHTCTHAYSLNWHPVWILLSQQRVVLQTLLDPILSEVSHLLMMVKDTLKKMQVNMVDARADGILAFPKYFISE